MTGTKQPEHILSIIGSYYLCSVYGESGRERERLRSSVGSGYQREMGWDIYGWLQRDLNEFDVVIWEDTLLAIRDAFPPPVAIILTQWGELYLRAFHE